jgi:tRNA(adenine34) deaminase
MRLALAQAREAADAGEVPVGAVITQGRRIVGRAYNQVELLKDPTAHAEMIAITQAATALGNWRLEDTVLYVTKEPCPMCAGAIVQARIPNVFFGVPDPKRGGAVSLFNIFDHPNLNHTVQVSSGLLEDECRDLLQGFFQSKR